MTHFELIDRMPTRMTGAALMCPNSLSATDKRTALLDMARRDLIDPYDKDIAKTLVEALCGVQGGNGLAWQFLVESLREQDLAKTTDSLDYLAPRGVVG